MFASSTTLSKLEQHLQQGEASRVACCEALALGAAVAMADLVRQVEVHCLERGRALALVWNLYTAAVTTGTGAAPPPAASFFFPRDIQLGQGESPRTGCQLNACNIGRNRPH